MPENLNVRWRWLKLMYIYTIVGAGGFGLGILVVPDLVASLMGLPSQDPIVYGVVGSIYVAFGILSILGLRSPLKFVPILFLQLCYKAVWFIGVALRLLIAGQFPVHGILFAVIFASYIVGDLIAIPFSYLFAKEKEDR